MNQRGWTWEESDEGSSHDEALVPLIEQLVHQWNLMYNREEQDRFTKQRMYECGAEEQEPDFDTAEEQAAYEAAQAAMMKRNNMRWELIELQLHHMGVRMMRPYEHHNEEERLIEWLERDREGE